MRFSKVRTAVKMRELTILKMPIKSYNIHYNMIKIEIIRLDFCFANRFAVRDN